MSACGRQRQAGDVKGTASDLLAHVAQAANLPRHATETHAGQLAEERPQRQGNWDHERMHQQRVHAFFNSSAHTTAIPHTTNTLYHRRHRRQVGGVIPQVDGRIPQVDGRIPQVGLHEQMATSHHPSSTWSRDFSTYRVADQAATPPLQSLEHAWQTSIRAPMHDPQRSFDQAWQMAPSSVGPTAHDPSPQRPFEQAVYHQHPQPVSLDQAWETALQQHQPAADPTAPQHQHTAPTAHPHNHAMTDTHEAAKATWDALFEKAARLGTVRRPQPPPKHASPLTRALDLHAEPSPTRTAPGHDAAVAPDTQAAAQRLQATMDATAFEPLQQSQFYHFIQQLAADAAPDRHTLLPETQGGVFNEGG